MSSENELDLISMVMKWPPAFIVVETPDGQRYTHAESWEEFSSRQRELLQKSLGNGQEDTTKNYT
jgi:hypothetical protein